MSDFTRSMADKIESGMTDIEDASDYTEQIEMLVGLVRSLLENEGNERVIRDVEEVLAEIG